MKITSEKWRPSCLGLNLLKDMDENDGQQSIGKPFQVDVLFTEQLWNMIVYEYIDTDNTDTNFISRMW